jgi:hypothetical protein
MRFACSLRTLGIGLGAPGLFLAALALGPSPISGAGESKLDPALCAPGRNTFTLAIDNGYFPLRVGQRWAYTGSERGGRVGLQITVLGATVRLFRAGKRVTTRVVEEREWADTNGNGRVDSGENLIEVSRNYFAQSQRGTVCYFGEVVDIYDGGAVVSHGGSWRADARGNAPGVFMPGRPKVGMKFQQEIAPGIAEDTATIIDSGVRTKVPAGTFRDTLVVRDRNPLDGSTGTKTYARGVGLVIDGPVKLIRH